ncbi:hypothetical protein KIW84_015507 [Lathyrus oleraceus]|uniref:Retrovirus-related Pol polyprotein from transposon TNT 1-94-like beta-barrel domain-containing protein n=1 Tax=Pisum sativum TaxID=3888 RepID=A0A9D5BR56_PEA|nr:hypothetical protein KIW84_015507 [Pisum sativum]
MSKDEEMLLMAYIEASEEKGHTVWFLDSGCSNHMSKDLSLFCTMEEGFKREVSLGNHMKMKVVGKGSVRLNLAGVRHVVQEVFYIPELKNNLLSIGQLQEKGLAFLIKNNECKIYHPSKGLILESRMTLNRMFILLSKTSSVANKSSECCFQTDIQEIAHLWHCRDVVFEENKKWDWNTSHSEFRNDQLEWGDMDITIADQESDTVTPQDQSKHEETIEYSGDIGHSADENEEVENAAGIEIATEDENAVATTESSAVEGQRIRRTPRWMDDYVVNSVVANSDVAASFDPQSFDEAVLNNNWKKAMDAEIHYSSIHDFFEYISLIVTITSSSCKRKDALTEAQHQDILNKLDSGEISRGKGLHQSSSLTRPGDTRWGSHHTTLLHLDMVFCGKCA